MKTTDKQMKAALISNFKRQLDKKSKWYYIDVSDFIVSLNQVHPDKLKEMYNRMAYINSDIFMRYIEKEEDKLMKAGMYDIRKMKPENCLD